MLFLARHLTIYEDSMSCVGQEILFLARHLTIYEDYTSCVGQEILFLARHLTYSPHENPYRNASSAWALGQGIKFPTLGTNKTPPSGLRPSGWYFVCPRAGNFIPALAPMRKSDISFIYSEMINVLANHVGPTIKLLKVSGGDYS